MKHAIWLERGLPEEHAPLLAGVTLLGPGTATPQDPLCEIATADGIIAASKVRYDAELMDRAPRLRVICRTGIGYDNINVADATERGIAVCNAPDGPTISTAEHAIALLFAVAKNLGPLGKALRSSERCDFFGRYTGVELDGLQLGLVGCGRIGRRVAAIARAVGMRVFALDPLLDSATAEKLGVGRADSLASLLAASDVVSLHVPLTSETRHLINCERLGQMKSGAILINTARGGLVDEVSLADALDSGHLWGAGLDVFDPEPPPPDHPLLNHERVIATPHTAAATAAGKRRLWETAIRQALAVLAGERPAHLVNAAAWPRAGEPRVE